MTPWHYFIQTNLYLTLCCVFYFVFLRKETFHHWNRFFLIGGGIVSLLLPFFAEYFLSKWIQPPVISQENIPVWILPTVLVEPSSQTKVVSWYELIYWFGFSISIVLLWVRTYLTYQIFKQKKGAWSFLNKVYVHPKTPNFNTIWLHEQIHARQLHTLDLLFWEILILFFWMNPAVYALRKASRLVHEFIADDRAARSLSNPGDYATLLVHHQLGSPLLNSLEHQFFTQSNLKSRIQMIMKKRSNRISLLKYGFALPLFGLAITLSSAKIADQTEPEVIQITLNEIKQETTSLPLPKLLVKSKKVEIRQDTVRPKERVIFTKVDELPEFPGGISQMYKWIGTTILYPQEAVREKAQGKVFVRFVIEADGSVGEPTILKGIHPALDAEALRVIQKMPKWEAGKVNGQAVALYYNMPIMFSLGESFEAKENKEEKPKESGEFKAAPSSQLVSDLSVIGYPAKSPTFQGEASILEIVDDKNSPGKLSFPEDTEVYINKIKVDNKDVKRVHVNSIQSISIDKSDGQKKIFIELKKK